MIDFKLKGEYIELIKLLKATNACETGGEAKMVVNEGLVKVNGEIESRKRLKVKIGDVIEFETVKISVISE
ncbi:MAG: RNA-binding S4 domain-containing protein [Flammeovirgaceae bacterium]|nr:RNA-binding S4 domain-containing protein [Flammeovirgaceae bacterium]